MEKNAEYGGQPEILAQVHAIERPITVHSSQTKALYLENFLLIALAQTFFIIQKNVTILRVTQENNTVEST